MAQNAFYRVHFRRTINTHVHCYEVLEKPFLHHFWIFSITVSTYIDAKEHIRLTIKQIEKNKQIIDGHNDWHSIHTYMHLGVMLELLKILLFVYKMISDEYEENAGFKLTVRNESRCVPFFKMIECEVHSFI